MKKKRDGRLSLKLAGLALAAALGLSFQGGETGLALAATMKLPEIEKFVKSASDDRAMVIDSFEVPGQNITGLIIRGKRPGEAVSNGLEALAFMFSNEKKLVSADFIYGEDGEDLAKRYAFHLNQAIIINGVGRALQDSPGADGKPVKTVFVYFDPFCRACHELAAGPVPRKFLDQRVRMIWIPVLANEGSQPYGTYFLHSGKMAQEGEPVTDAISCCPPDVPCQCGSVIIDNTRRLLSLGSGDKLATPFLVWPVAGEGPGFDYMSGIPDESKVRNIADRVIPISYKPFDGSSPPYTGASINNGPNLMEKK